MAALETEHLFFCGIGGSGMMPLALIAKSTGVRVSGSDRSRDQGKLPEKFLWLEQQGIPLFPQNGQGLTPDISRLVISTAVEDHIPDIQAAKKSGIPIVHRSELLADFFNQAKIKVAVGGTSGKSTVTGMIGYILQKLGHDPVVMNGGIFKNFAADNPYCTALTGRGDVFVTESDESDGSISRYFPDIAVINNVALDHKPLPELLDLFEGFIARSRRVVLNLDNQYCRNFAADNRHKCITFSLINQDADICAANHDLQLAVIGNHNVANALAAIAVAQELGINSHEAIEALKGFQGIKRRLDKIGERNGIIVIDDFGHNPDKIAASLAALKQTYADRRLLVFFQPHGFALLRQLHEELADAFTQGLSKKDRLYLVEPYYVGGTADRSVTSADLLKNIHLTYKTLGQDRADIQRHLLSEVRTGDVIVVMGARDDTLSDFAANILYLIGAGDDGA